MAQPFPNPPPRLQDAGSVAVGSQRQAGARDSLTLQPAGWGKQWHRGPCTAVVSREKIPGYAGIASAVRGEPGCAGEFRALRSPLFNLGKHNGRSFAFDFRHLGLVFAVRSTRSSHGQKYWYFSSLPEYPDNPSPLNLILENFVGILYL